MTTTIDGYELKPCPFCGGEKLAFSSDGFRKPVYFVICMNIGCMMNGPLGNDPSGAADKWNERHGFTDPLDAWKDTP